MISLIHMWTQFRESQEHQPASKSSDIHESAIRELTPLCRTSRSDCDTEAKVPVKEEVQTNYKIVALRRIQVQPGRRTNQRLVREHYAHGHTPFFWRVVDPHYISPQLHGLRAVWPRRLHRDLQLRLQLRQVL